MNRARVVRLYVFLPGLFFRRSEGEESVFYGAVSWYDYFALMGDE